MKYLFATFFMVMGLLTFGQSPNLPKAVTDSFDKLFPNEVISSWTDNGYYDFASDWNNNMYFGDYNFDGYPDNYLPYNSPYYSYYNGITSPYYNYTYNNGYEYTVPPNYVQPVYKNPTQYQLDFSLNGVSMSAIFKPNGTFIIAKAYINTLPAKVQHVVLDAFKGQTFVIANHKEEMITPEYPKSNPVYRVKVKIKHGANHILKIDSTGKIISNDKI